MVISKGRGDVKFRSASKESLWIDDRHGLQAGLLADLLENLRSDSDAHVGALNGGLARAKSATVSCIPIVAVVLVHVLLKLEGT